MDVLHHALFLGCFSLAFKKNKKKAASHVTRPAHSLHVSECEDNRLTADVENLPPKKKKIPVRYLMVKEKHRVMFWTVAKKQQQQQQQL